MSNRRLEREYERICSGLLAGTVSGEDVPAVLDNLFYERFGMSVCEILAGLALQTQQKLPLPIDIAAEFH